MANTPFEILGEDGIQELCNAFYDAMKELPEVEDIRRMHADDLSPMKIKLAEYLTGWMGGPPRYSDKYGTVCMTDPHKPYKIGPKERDQWLLCMNTALERTNASEELKEMLKVPMFRIAEAIRNHDGSPSAADTDPNIIASN
jgi:hemoglobin